MSSSSRAMERVPAADDLLAPLDRPFVADLGAVGLAKACSVFVTRKFGGEATKRRPAEFRNEVRRPLEFLRVR